MASGGHIFYGGALTNSLVMYNLLTNLIILLGRRSWDG